MLRKQAGFLDPYIISESTALDDGNLERIKAFEDEFEQISLKKFQTAEEI